MTAIAATKKKTTRQISDRRAVWEGSIGTGVGICGGSIVWTAAPVALHDLHELATRLHAAVTGVPPWRATREVPGRGIGEELARRRVNLQRVPRRGPGS